MSYITNMKTLMKNNFPLQNMYPILVNIKSWKLFAIVKSFS